MRDIIRLDTHRREELVDITDQVVSIVKKSKINNGMAFLYAQGATSAIMIQENWDASVRTDVINCLQKLIPSGIWLHDRQDSNGDAHLKAGLIGPSQSIPLINGRLGLSQWQNIFFCEFDGPRQQRFIICTILADEN